jgi:hypothetical protein
VLRVAKKVTKVAGMTPLQTLILDRMHDRGWDPVTVENRGVAHATLHRYMNPVLLRQMPRQSVIKSLARALDLTEDSVRNAAWLSMEANKDRPELDPTTVHRLHELDVGDEAVSVRLSRRDGQRLRQSDVVQSVALASRFLAETAGQTADVDWLVKVDRLAAEGIIAWAEYDVDREAAVAAYNAARRSQPEDYATAAREGEDERPPMVGDEGA